MFPGVIAVKVHLAGVSVRESSELQVEDHQAAQAAVEEKEVHAIPLVVDAQPPLTANERKVVAQLKEESFKVANEGILQIGLGVFVAQAKKFEDERMADFLIGADGVAGPGFGPLGEHGGLVAREGGAFVELAVHLPLELAHGPAAAQSFGVVEGEGFGRT